MQMPNLNFDDIYGAWPTPWWLRPGIWVLLFFALFMLFVVFYLLWWFFKRHVKQECPYRTLTRVLEVLQADRAGGAIDLHEYAVRLGDALRKFITQVDGTVAIASTEYELALIVDRCPCDDTLRQLLKKVFAWSIEPKFFRIPDGTNVDRDLPIIELIARLHLLIEQMKHKK